MSHSNPNPRPRPRWFAPSSIPPILLLTFVTSFAFNHALISTQRRQDLRSHRIRTALLEETIDYNSRLLFYLNPPNSSRGWLFSRSKKTSTQEPEWIGEEREALRRRWRSVGVNPMEQGLLPRGIGEREKEGEVGEVGEGKARGEVTWGEIFLGSKEKRSSLTERWQKVTSGIRDSFTLQSRSQDGPTAEEEEKDLEELSKLWSSLDTQS